MTEAATDEQIAQMVEAYSLKDEKRPPELTVSRWRDMKALIARIEQEQARTQDALDMSKGWCVWCEQLVPNAAAMKEHSAGCPRHPLRATIERLELIVAANKTAIDFDRATIKRLRKALRYYAGQGGKIARAALEVLND